MAPDLCILSGWCGAAHENYFQCKSWGVEKGGGNEHCLSIKRFNKVGLPRCFAFIVAKGLPQIHCFSAALDTNTEKAFTDLLYFRS